MRRLRIFGRRLGKDERGYVLITLTLLIPVVMGLIGLTTDLARRHTLHTELQNIADAAALAGARELDGTANAITNATAAAKAFITATPRFQNAGLTTYIVDDDNGTNDIKFFKGDDCRTPASTSAEASCIQVTTVPRSIDVWFATLIGAASTADTGATATAQSQYIACAVQPLFICNPYEGSDAAHPKEFTGVRGQMFRLKGKGGNTSYFPGDFGFLDPLNDAGSAALAYNLAQNSPNFCYVNNVGVNPGTNVSAVTDGIGVRFDMKTSGGSAHATEMNALPPAPNVIKGYIPTNSSKLCQYPSSPNGKPLPRDNCFPVVGSTGNAAIPTCVGPEGQAAFNVGNGNWSAGAAAYWNWHHTGTMPTGLGDPATNTMTRFDLYLKETGCDEATGTCTGPASTQYAWKTSPTSPIIEEKPAPQCMSGTGNLERRLIYAAIIDCQNLNITGNSKIPITPSRMGKFFLTEPGDSGAIYAEFVKLIKPNDDSGKLHHVVQLVRDFQPSN